MKLAVVLVLTLAFACGGKKSSTTTSPNPATKSMGGYGYGGTGYGGNTYGGAQYGGR